MDNTLPSPLDAGLSATASSRSFRRAEPVRHRLAITFSGSGSEYFRIWIVNLLLTLVTLGLYYPWAKVRRLRYFYGNTSVAGHAFDFHGQPRRMLRGFLLVGAMALLYGLAGEVSPISGLIAGAIVASLLPALFRASQQFRMANTSWRGLRFRFNGDLPGAYRATLPLFLMGALFFLVPQIDFASEKVRVVAHSGTIAAALVGAAVIMPLFVPLLVWMLKKYQHGHYVLGPLQTEWRASVGSVYAIAAKTVGLVVLATVLIVLAVLLVAFGGGLLTLMAGGAKASAGGIEGLVGAVVAGVMAFYTFMFVVVQPYVVSRMQNLVWGRTGSSQVRFQSNLRFRPLALLTLKNLLLIFLTLGLYWPFAKVAMARLRLESVTVVTRLAPDELMSTWGERADDAAGAAAGDLFGIDAGL